MTAPEMPELPPLHMPFGATTSNGVIRCWAHSPGVDIPAAYLWYTASGNKVPLCAPCCAEWRSRVADDQTHDALPLRITDLIQDAE